MLLGPDRAGVVLYNYKGIGNKRDMQCLLVETYKTNPSATSDKKNEDAILT